LRDNFGCNIVGDKCSGIDSKNSTKKTYKLPSETLNCGSTCKNEAFSIVQPSFLIRYIIKT